MTATWLETEDGEWLNAGGLYGGRYGGFVAVEMAGMGCWCAIWRNTSGTSAILGRFVAGFMAASSATNSNVRA
jgi:hypothetical protein